jgi:hypothetical protein
MSEGRNDVMDCPKSSEMVPVTALHPSPQRLEDAKVGSHSGRRQSSAMQSPTILGRYLGATVGTANRTSASGAREGGRRPHRPRAHHRRHGSASRTTPSRGGAVGQIQWLWSSAPLRSGTSTPIPSAGCATVHRLCVSWWLTTPLDSASSFARRLGHGSSGIQPVVVSGSAEPQPVVGMSTRDPAS